MPLPHQNWQSLGLSGLYGQYTGGSGGGATGPVTRDRLDAMRMGVGRVPSAEYPDGYLGTIRSRRDDRVLDSIVGRENQKAYQRGVHKGERIDMGDYFWPQGLDPERGLRNQVRGVRTAPAMGLAPAPHLVNDGKAGPHVIADQLAEINPVRQAQMSYLMPSWGY